MPGDPTADQRHDLFKRRSRRSVNGGVKVGLWGGVILGQARRFGAAASEARPSLRRSERAAAGALRLMQS